MPSSPLWITTLPREPWRTSSPTGHHQSPWSLLNRRRIPMPFSPSWITTSPRALWRHFSPISHPQSLSNLPSKNKRRIPMPFSPSWITTSLRVPWRISSLINQHQSHLNLHNLPDRWRIWSQISETSTMPYWKDVAVHSSKGRQLVETLLMEIQTQETLFAHLLHPQAQSLT